ncbi:MAG: hypothetical protein RQ952_05745 [Thermoproteota archaeon]|nr:hypothetical protein [Thermoproteota archaeon]
MKRFIKLEARIAFINLVRVDKKRIMSMVIYRAGYIEDVEFHEIKNAQELLQKIVNSRHFKQIRYVVIKGNISEMSDSLFNNFPLPIIYMNKKIRLYNLTEEEFKIINSRNFLRDGLNISKIISNLIKHYDKILP